MPTYKYEADLARFRKCPPAAAKKTVAVAYRYVHNPMTAACCFVPRALQPPRKNRPSENTCDDYGLSMFITDGQARAAHARLRTFPQFVTIVGEHLARISLVPDSGLQTEPNAGGHFDLHEFIGVDLTTASIVIGQL